MHLVLFLVLCFLNMHFLCRGSCSFSNVSLTRFCNASRATMEKEGLNSAFKMEDITVMGAAELFPHMFRIWVTTRFSLICNKYELTRSFQSFIQCSCFTFG